MSRRCIDCGREMPNPRALRCKRCHKRRYYYIQLCNPVSFEPTKPESFFEPEAERRARRQALKGQNSETLTSSSHP